MSDASTNARITELEDLLGSIELYVSWKEVTRQLTTQERELWAQAVEESSSRMNAGDPDAVRRVQPRWWL